MMNVSPLCGLAALRLAMPGPLPGWPAQCRMLPLPRTARQPLGPARPAAVLLAVMPRTDGLRILLTQRSAQTRHHPEQISLPGGGVELTDPTPWAAAVREAQEEVGLDPADVETLGPLTPLHVAASNYLVQPYVGWVAQPPSSWQPSSAEVAEVIELPLGVLLDPAAYAEETWPLPQGDTRVPYYRYATHRVWGATAMILSEFAVLLAALGRTQKEQVEHECY